jgi:serine/threonine-protein kinase
MQLSVHVRSFLMSTRDLEVAAPESIVDERYVVRREIACGGVGCVFEAEHVITRAKVALKTLTRPALDHRTAHTRLMREARVLGALRHPNIVLVQDAGFCDKHGPFIALEMIDGRPLDGILVARRTLGVGQAIAMLVQLCDALGAVHSREIVHRDIKPANILISRTSVGDAVELIDFGVASVGKDDDVVEEKLTKMGEILGTVEYMSPEQLMASAPVSASTDVYAAGIVLYECLAGDVPFSGSPTAIIAGMLQGQRPPSLRAVRADVPLELDAVIQRALEVDPEKRYRSARELAQACVAAIGGSAPSLDLLEVERDKDQPFAHAPGASPPDDVPDPRRRQFVRAPYVTPVRILLPNGLTRDGRTEDISEGGVLIVTDNECARDQRVKVRLPLPSTGRVVTVDAVTRWIKTGRNRRAVGVEFQDPPEDLRAEIRDYVALMTVAFDPEAAPIAAFAD